MPLFKVQVRASIEVEADDYWDAEKQVMTWKDIRLKQSFWHSEHTVGELSSVTKVEVVQNA